MKKILVFVLICALFLTPVLGDITIRSKPIANSIYLDEQARYSLVIYNEDYVSKVVQVSSSNVEWYVELEPSITMIGPNETINTRLKLIPNEWAQPGSKIVKIIITSPTTDESYSVELPVYVKAYDVERKDYSPSVQQSISYPKEINPTDSINLQVYLRNRNRLDIEDMQISVESSLFREARTVSLGGLAERKENFVFKLDDLAKPQDLTFEVKLIIGNNTINNDRAVIKILQYANFMKKEETTEELFKKTTEYYLVNQGNVNKIDTIKLKTSFFSRLFTKTTPQADKINLKEGYFEWTLNLGPMEESKIQVVVNYRPIIYLFLIGLVAVLVYFIYRSPVVVKKESLVIGSSHDGITEVKVLLHIRNRTQDIIERLSAADLIPSIATIVEEAKVGTIMPSKIIRHDRKGTIIKWDIEVLEPFEERIISYRLKSKITIVGGFTLPPAKIRFDTKGGKERIIKSNASQVSLGI